jgi:hypothetical protein
MATMRDLRWFRLYLRESWLFTYEELCRKRLTDALVAALVALALSLLVSGAPVPAAIEASHVVIWLAATALILLLVVSPFRLWQAQDMRSAMQRVQIADLEYQLADRQSSEIPWQEVLDGLSGYVEIGSELQQKLVKGADPDSIRSGRDVWSASIEHFLDRHLGQSYATQFRQPCGHATLDAPAGLSAQAIESWADIQGKKDAVAVVLAEIANQRLVDESSVLELLAAPSSG